MQNNSNRLSLIASHIYKDTAVEVLTRVHTGSLFLGGLFLLCLSLNASATQLSEIPSSALPVVLNAISDNLPAYHIQPSQKPAENLTGNNARHIAHNPAQQIDFIFDAHGFKTNNPIPNARQLQLQLTGYGYADDIRLIKPVKPAVTAQGRIEYHYDKLSEWYINSPLGLEHGFTLNAPPLNSSSSDINKNNNAVVQLTYDTELKARSMPDGQGVQFVDVNGKPVYRYSRLKAWDANGQMLQTSMHVQNGMQNNMLSLQVDVQQAQFPITVDPLFENETKLTASNGLAGDGFGFSVDVDGEWMAVGAPIADAPGKTSTGAVYTFRRQGTTWSQFVDDRSIGFLEGNSVSLARFGFDVAIRQTSSSGSPILVVGARSETNTAGAMYVYEFGWFCSDIDLGDYQCWGQKTRLVGSQVTSNDQFGYSVDIDNDTIVVGALHDEGPSPATIGTGAAYVFKCNVILFGGFGPGGGYCANWNEEKQLLPGVGALLNDSFGIDVSIDDGLIAVGASSDDSAAIDAGAVYMFRNIVVGNSGVPFFTPIFDWVLEQKITEGALAGDNFGRSVAVAGNKLVAGASLANDGPNTGAARVYSYSASWNLDATLLPLQSDNVTPDAVSSLFGYSVDFNLGSYPGQDDYILVGAFLTGGAAGGAAGSAYLYQRNGSSWAQVKKYTASDASANDFYGRSVAMDASTLVIGADLDDDKGSGSGSVYLYRSPTGTSVDLQLSSNSLVLGSTLVTSTTTLSVAGIAAPDALLAGQSVTLTITGPDSVNIVVPLTTDNNGVASLNVNLPIVGTWTARASYAGNAGLEWEASGTLEQEVFVNAHAGYAVVIEGSQFADGSPQELSVQKSSDLVYRTLIARGFTSDRIFYFGQSIGGDVDALATNSDINNYLVSNNPVDGLDSLLELSKATAAPLHVFVVGQAQKGGVFYLNPDNGPASQPETLSATQLDSILDTLELEPAMQAQPRTITIATPYSGGFIPLLSSATPAGRIVLTSTTAAGPAFKGPEEQDGIEPASLFLGELVSRLAEGNDLNNSYEFARSQSAQFSRADDSNLTAAGQYVDNSLQKTMLDDNGDGVGSHLLSIGSVGGIANDGAVASSVYLGNGNTDSNDFQVSNTQNLAAPSSATLILTQESGTPSNNWTVAIRDPDIMLNSIASEEQISLPFTRLNMFQFNGTFFTSYNFSQSGKYEAWLWGEDAITGRETLSKRSVIYVDTAGNLAPSAPVINYPVSGETNIGTQFEIDWQPSTDADGDAVTYRLLISTANNVTGGVLDAANVQFQADEFTSSSFSVSATAALVAGSRYYWQVISIDRWGAQTVGPVQDFTPTDPGSVYSLFSLFGGTVRSGLTSALQGATVTWLPAINSDPSDESGIYFMRASLVVGASTSQTQGPCFGDNHYVGNIRASLGGYNSSPDVSVDFCTGDLLGDQANFILTPSSAPVDSDGDGLTDAEEAIIGTNPNEADSDFDGVSDYDEVIQDGNKNNYTPGVDLNPWNSDTDNDGFSDGFEFVAGGAGDALDPLSAPIWGDINGDGTVNVADALLSVQIVLGTISPAADDGMLMRGNVAPLIGGAPDPANQIPDPMTQLDAGDLLVLHSKILGLASY